MANKKTKKLKPRKRTVLKKTKTKRRKRQPKNSTRSTRYGSPT